MALSRLRKLRRVARSAVGSAIKSAIKEVFDSDKPAESDRDRGAVPIPDGRDQSGSLNSPEISNHPSSPPEELRPMAVSPARAAAPPPAADSVVEPQPREPVATRTMARVLMSQQAWSRAYAIYETLVQESSQADVLDLALLVERASAGYEHALEEDMPQSLPCLRVEGSELLLEIPDGGEPWPSWVFVHQDAGGARAGSSQAACDVSILYFDRSNPVDWEITAKEGSSSRAGFRFHPAREGYYSLVQFGPDGLARWLTPMVLWPET